MPLHNLLYTRLRVGKIQCNIENIESDRLIAFNLVALIVTKL